MAELGLKLQLSSTQVILLSVYNCAPFHHLTTGLEETISSTSPGQGNNVNTHENEVNTQKI